MVDLRDLFGPLEWMEQAACLEHDPEIFFPLKGGSTVFVKSICAGCPVLEECREHALASVTPLEGIWGGTSERERRKLRNQRRRQS
jgi:WhiB family redox-sensing transcriptional regulator